jgi:hypothetical protein
LDDNTKIGLRKIILKLKAGTGIGLCPTAGFDIKEVETSSSAGRNTYRNSFAKCEGKKSHEDLGIDRRMMITLILKK